MSAESIPKDTEQVRFAHLNYRPEADLPENSPYQVSSRYLGALGVGGEYVGFDDPAEADDALGETTTPDKSKAVDQEITAPIYNLKGLHKGLNDKDKTYVGASGNVEYYDDLTSEASSSRTESAVSPQLKRKQAKALKGFERIEHWLEPENVINLKELIDNDIRKRTEEAHLLGNNYQLGFDPVKLKSEVTMRHLGKYYGATESELADGNKVPQWAQDKVQDLLDMPYTQLEQVAKDVKSKTANGLPEINKYVRSLSPDEFKKQREIYRQEIYYVVGKNKTLLKLPQIKQKIAELGNRRAAELYYIHEAKEKAKQKIHTFVPINGHQINRIAKQTVVDMDAYRQQRQNQAQAYRRYSRAA